MVIAGFREVMSAEFKAYWLREHFDLTTSAASIAWAAWQEGRRELESAAAAVAALIGGAKDRMGRPDVVSDDMRNARARVLELATRYGVQGGHHTYLDQCAAVLRAANQQGQKT